MKNILVILDKPKHDQVALQRALQLAASNQAQLHLVSFVYEPLFTATGMHEMPEDVVEEMKRGRESWLEKLHDQYQLPSDTEAEAVWHYNIANWVLETLSEKPYDLVIKTAQKQFGRGGFGSIDWRLIEQSPAPVWLAVNTPWIKHNRLVAAVDPALNNPLHQELNRRVLIAGDKLAKRLGSDLEVAASLRIPGALKELGLVKKPNELASELQILRGHLEKIITDHDVSCSKINLVTGKPAREVNRIVDRNKARLMLVGRGVRKGPAGFLLGNTAERILSKANTDVLVVP